MCGKKFNSRKRLSKHACKPKPEEVQETVSKVSEAKRARRAKARQARKLKKREEQPNAQVTDVDTSVSTDEDVRSETSDSTVIANIHTVNTAVTEVLRVKTDILCEVCEKPAVGLRRGVYPKCFAHRADPYQFEYFT
jgi:hypothetical protein